MPTLAESPALDKRLATAVATLLSAVPGLSGMTIGVAETDAQYSTPCIVVSASRLREVIYNSGVHEYDISAELRTTAHSGDNATTAEQLLDLDASLEEFFFKQSLTDLATAIDAATEYGKVYCAQSPQSNATEFNEEKRNIEYKIQVQAIGLAEE